MQVDVLGFGHLERKVVLGEARTAPKSSFVIRGLGGRPGGGRPATGSADQGMPVIGFIKKRSPGRDIGELLQPSSRLAGDRRDMSAKTPGLGKTLRLDSGTSISPMSKRVAFITPGPLS